MLRPIPCLYGNISVDSMLTICAGRMKEFFLRNKDRLVFNPSKQSCQDMPLGRTYNTTTAEARKNKKVRVDVGLVALLERSRSRVLCSFSRL